MPLSCRNCQSLKIDLETLKNFSAESVLLMKGCLRETDDLIKRYREKLLESAGRLHEMQELRIEIELLKLRCELAEEKVTCFSNEKDSWQKMLSNYERQISSLIEHVATLRQQNSCERAAAEFLQRQTSPVDPDRSPTVIEELLKIGNKDGQNAKDKPCFFRSLDFDHTQQSRQMSICEIFASVELREPLQIPDSLK